MIKRSAAALSLLLFITAVCVSSYVVICKTTDQIKQELEASLEFIEKGEIDSALEKLEQSEEKWDKYKTVFDVFLDHSMLEDLNVSFPSIRPFLEGGSTETAKEKIEESIRTLERITDEQKVSIGNIL